MLAAGTTTNFFGNKHIEEEAMPMKNVSEAMGLRNALLANLERAVTCSNKQEQQELLNVVVVGGGATGVEVAGVLSEMKKFVLPNDYPDMPSSLMHIYLIEAGPRLLAGMSEDSSSHAEQFLREMGVNILLNKRVTDYRNHKVTLEDGSEIATRTFIWVSGVTGVSFGNMNAAAIGLLLIPIISGVIQLAMTIYSTAKQKKLNPEASAQMGSMNMMLYIMPLFSVWIAFSYPAGIGFYWICSSLVGLIQMFVLNKIYTPEYVAKLVEKDKLKKKNQKKSGIMQKYNDMLQEQLKQQNGGTSNNGRMTSAPVVRDEETGEEIKLSKSQAKDYERRIIAEARRKQAEMYGDGSVSSDNDLSLIHISEPTRH